MSSAASQKEFLYEDIQQFGSVFSSPKNMEVLLFWLVGRAGVDDIRSDNIPARLVSRAARGTPLAPQHGYPARQTQRRHQPRSMCCCGTRMLQVAAWVRTLGRISTSDIKGKRAGSEEPQMTLRRYPHPLAVPFLPAHQLPTQTIWGLKKRAAQLVSIWFSMRASHMPPPR